MADELLRLIHNNDIGRFQERLIQHATDANYLNKRINRITPLQYAILNDKFDFIHLLVQNPLVKIDPDSLEHIVVGATNSHVYPDYQLQRPSRYMEILKTILENRTIDLNKKTDDMTLLHLLMRYYCWRPFAPAVIAQLILHGADPSKKIGYGDIVARTQQRVRGFIADKMSRILGNSDNRLASSPYSKSVLTGRFFRTAADMGRLCLENVIRQWMPDQPNLTLSQFMQAKGITNQMILDSRPDVALTPEDLKRIGIHHPIPPSTPHHDTVELAFMLGTIALSMRMVDTENYERHKRAHLLRKSLIPTPPQKQTRKRKAQKSPTPTTPTTPTPKKIRQDVLRYTTRQMDPHLVQQIARFIS